jgi:DNA adenine methylase
MKIVNRTLQKSISERIILAELEAKKIRPPLKWAGGKYQILEQIKKALPPGNRLIEPFVGSGVVFLNTNSSVTF